ncbi:MAG: hydantoinase/oxoprolinase family protein [Candidatus Tectomicrobia bacterium]|nr:hydantoinase/oxoprolinase family protein [Candidatus Tectomicrobia bacterium]
MSFRIGVDCGGTFTDFVCVDGEGVMRDFKESSTPGDFARGVIRGLEKAAKAYGKALEKFLGEVDLIVHGTTVATNTVLTLTGAATGLITTQGFRDILELRRGMKEDTFNWREPFPQILAPRHLRMEVPERVLYTGEVLAPLDEEAVRQAVRKLKAKGARSIAVCLLFSFLHPDHERRVGEIIREEFPEAFVSLSSQVLPQIREYERVSTTVLDADVGPRLKSYLESLDRSLRERGFRGSFLVMQSNGGVQSWQEATSRPVTCISSGPAASVPAAISIGDTADRHNLISFDMGGTSCDVAFIEGGKIPLLSRGGIYRSIGDYTNASPSIDLHHVGAGGGSVAWLDAGGILHVGPRSAGADPGPACYGRGGTEPTLTDANLILGVLPVEGILGGEMPLDLEAARKTMREKVAEPLGLGIVEAALAVVTVINTVVAGAIANAAHKRGLDTRDFTLLAGGGLGPAHAASLAQELRAPSIIAPKRASTYCAFGMLLSDLRHNYVHSYYTKTASADLGRINALYQEMEARGRRVLEQEGVLPDRMEFRRSLDMRYAGQFYEIEVPAPEGTITRESLSGVVDRFHRLHQEIYAFSVAERPTEMLNYKLAAVGHITKPHIKPLPSDGADSPTAARASRPVFFAETREFVETAVYDGRRLPPGHRIDGPAVIEEPFTTVAVPPRFQCEVDPFGNYLIRVPR